MAEVIAKNKIPFCTPISTVHIRGEQERDVPLYNVDSLAGLNYMIGYAIHKYRGYRVLYRGTTELYDSITPSVFRNKASRDVHHNNAYQRLKDIVRSIVSGTSVDGGLDLAGSLELDHEENKKLPQWVKNFMVEGMLQHYGLRTRCLDAVDNHWVALWFGLNRYVANTDGGAIYAHYTSRIEGLDNPLYLYELERNKEDFYQYMWLLAVKQEIDLDNREAFLQEVYPKGEPEENYTLDLRSALPSLFLRPSAQHGWVIHTGRKKYDFTNELVAILRINIIDAYHWMGNGKLLTQANLFPSPQEDQNYAVLLGYLDAPTGNKALYNKHKSINAQLQANPLFEPGDIVRYTYA